MSFSNKRLFSIQRAYKIVKWFKEHKQLPKFSTGNKIEESHARWIYYKRISKNRPIWFQEIDDIFVKNGIVNLFNPDKYIGWSIRAINKAKKVVERTENRGSLPRWRYKRPLEFKDCHWISRKTLAKCNLSKTYKWYDEVEKVFVDKGFNNVFEKNRLSELEKVVALQKAKDVAIRAKIRGCLPNQLSKNKQEVKDFQRIMHIKSARNSSVKHSKWYKEYIKIFEEQGFFHVFVSKKTKILKKAKEIANRCKLRGFLPRYTQRKSRIQEYNDAHWIYETKRAKYSPIQGNGTRIWYPEYEKIFTAAGFPGIFLK